MRDLRHDILTIVELYHANDGWISRREIAQALDRKYSMLSSDDILMLRRLCKEGLIEGRQGGYDENGAIWTERWEYRYVEPLPKILEVARKKFKRVKHFE